MTVTEEECFLGKTILIVEDEQNIVDILCFNLVKEGYDTL